MTIMGMTMRMITPRTGIDRAMARTPQQRKNDRGQVKLVSAVLVVTMGAWLLAQMIGGQYGWPPKFIFLFDLMALAGFVFALVTTYRIWRNRQD